MHRYTVSLIRQVDADSAEEAALLIYQQVSEGNGPIVYLVADEGGKVVEVGLDRTEASAFAKEDHTADPGNW